MGRQFLSSYPYRTSFGSAAATLNLGRSARAAALLGVMAATLLWQAPVQAQTLSDDFWINAQAYYPKVDTQVRVDANTDQSIGTDIDFERDLDLDGKEVLPAVSAGARFGRVVVGADFFRLKRSGSVGIAREIEFDGATYPVNARVDSGFSSDIYRLTVGYAFVSKPDLEIGAALGLHATNFRVSLSGEASAGEGG